MRDLPNIDPRPFQRGRYVGYREGAIFTIGKGGVRGDLWWARETTPAPGKPPHGRTIFAKTLAAMSAKLAGPDAGLDN